MSQNYNINMKKFNGTDYDNLLPLAYNALNSQQLDGKTFNEIQNLFDSEITKRSLIATGSYVGTGTCGASHPTVINCGFKPKIILFFCDTTLISPEKVSESYLSKNGGQYKAGTNLNIKSNNVVSANGNSIFNQISRSCFEIKDNGRPYNLASFEERHEGYIAVHYATISFTPLETGVSFYTDDYAYKFRSSPVGLKDMRSADFQFNAQGITYYYVAIG